MRVRLICARHISGLCEDAHPEDCEHSVSHRPNRTCNDERVRCDDGSPTQCIPYFSEPDGEEPGAQGSA